MPWRGPSAWMRRRPSPGNTWRRFSRPRRLPPRRCRARSASAQTLCGARCHRGTSSFSRSTTATTSQRWRWQ
eukprot:3248268-Lingulodinium_polyedra.AAC.1